MVLNTNGEEPDCEDDDDGEQHLTTEKGGKGDGKKSQRKTTDLSRVKCYKCGKRGHYANSPECPEYIEDKSDESDTDDLGGDDKGVQNLNVELHPNEFSNFLLLQFMNQGWEHVRKKPIHLVNRVLLDNHANINMFCNPLLLTNICKGPRSMTVHCQAGSMSTDLI